MGRIRSLAVTAAAVTMFVVSAGASTASAATARNGKCEANEFCLYWDYGLFGSVSDFNTSIANYGSSQPDCYEFRTRGLNGYGECVKNNAMSAWNRTGRTVRVYYNSSYGGTYDVIKPGEEAELDNTFQENASHKLL